MEPLFSLPPPPPSAIRISRLRALFLSPPCFFLAAASSPDVTSAGGGGASAAAAAAAAARGRAATPGAGGGEVGVGLVKRSMDIRVGRLELWPDPPVLGRISHLIRFFFLSFVQALLVTHVLILELIAARA